MAKKQKNGLLEKAATFWWMARPWNVALPAAWAACGGLLAAGESVIVWRVVAAAAIAVVGWSTGQYINDYLDIEADTINAPYRPLPSGKVTVNELLVTYFFITTVGIGLSFLLNPYAGIVSLISAYCTLIYTKAKRKGILGSIMMGTVSATAPLYGSLAVTGKITPVVWIFAASTLLYILGINIAGTFEDLEGDEQAGIWTLPLLIGARPAAMVSASAFIISMAAAVAPYFLGYLSWYYLPFIAVVAVAGLFSELKFIKDPNPATGYKTLDVLRMLILVHIVCFVAGTNIAGTVLLVGSSILAIGILLLWTFGFVKLAESRGQLAA